MIEYIYEIENSFPCYHGLLLGEIDIKFYINFAFGPSFDSLPGLYTILYRFDSLSSSSSSSSMSRVGLLSFGRNV